MMACVGFGVQVRALGRVAGVHTAARVHVEMTQVREGECSEVDSPLIFMSALSCGVSTVIRFVTRPATHTLTRTLTRTLTCTLTRTLTHQICKQKQRRDDGGLCSFSHL